MKKYAIIFIILLFQGNTGWVDKSYKDLSELIHAADQPHIEVEEWEIIHLAKMEKTAFLSNVKELREKYIVITEEKEQAIKYHLRSDAKEGTEHDIYAVIPKGTDIINLQIVYNGKEWNDKIALNMTKTINKLKKHLQFDDDGIFTCVKLNFDGIMNLGLSVEKLMDNLKIVHTKEFEDNVENTIYGKTFYGYSPLFNQSIEVADKEMNFQLTTRNVTNNKKQVIIGTPLILNEY